MKMSLMAVSSAAVRSDQDQVLTALAHIGAVENQLTLKVDRQVIGKRLPAVGKRRNAEAAFEHADEVSGRFIPDALGDLENPHRRPPKHDGGVLHADVLQIGAGRL